MKRLIVSDVSGTVTDLEEGAAEFNRRFVQALTRVMQVCARDVASEVEEAMRFMDTTPHLNGWVVDGEVVAPATADPYVRMRTAAGLVLDLHNLMLNPGRREAWLDRIFAETRAGLCAVFKDDALPYLACLDRHGARFMSNTGADEARSWFNQLVEIVRSEAGAALLSRWFGWSDAETLDSVLDMLASCKERVHGEAGRQMVEPMLQVCVPELTIPGLERPVLLHRARYHRFLQQLLHEAEAKWSDLWVVGDIWELDGALPWVLGATVVMIDNGVMPDYERHWLARQERIHITETLTGARKILFG